MANEKKIYGRYCDAAVDALRAQYEMTKVIAHNASAGSAREAIIRDFLAAHLPEMTSPVSGVVFDSKGTYSKQQDIVFVLKSFPRLPFANGVDLIYVEGVVATVEIKTVINRSVWPSIAENLKSVRTLTPSSLGSAMLGDLDAWDETKIFSAVVTYGGASLETMRQAIVELPAETWPDVYLDLQTGMLVRNLDVLIPNGDGNDFVEIEGAGPAFARFLTYLTKITGQLVMRGVAWETYLE
ncbi:DUF6602 domain-containing protein [Dyella sp. 333MFSha]|uniref:DUF6602 domain-containing protein n=1 Tax=Dyella sp. 333MFSha TaxID=1798240 RepID=UPI00088CF3D3|nr:DUF6602 domain-containing protein [Dyella sp. 333MFSha]SDF39944.1 hypothetical protein SAMN04515659_0859 [Dyella sp. 333MFSha]